MKRYAVMLTCTVAYVAGWVLGKFDNNALLFVLPAMMYVGWTASKLERNT